MGFTLGFKDLCIYVKSLHKDVTFVNIFSLQCSFHLTVLLLILIRNTDF